MSIFKLLLTSLLGLVIFSAQAGDYKLGAGDVVSISVYQHPDLQITSRLTDSGEIRFPLLGTVKLSGKTEREAERILERRLAGGGFINQANVNLIVTEFNSVRASVLGKVNAPGEFSIQSSINLIQLMAKARGLTEDASSKITLYRGENAPRIIDIYADKDSQQARGLQIENGDVVVAREADAFFTIGEINKPGKYRFEPPMTVLQALAISGGWTVNASEKSIEITRSDKTGKPSTSRARMNDTVLANDIIRVKESLF